MKTHSNNLVMLAHIQLKSFYRLSTCDVTHVRKFTRPSPAYLLYCTASDGKLGEGLGTWLQSSLMERKGKSKMWRKRGTREEGTERRNQEEEN